MNYKVNVTRIENNSAFIEFKNEQGNFYNRVVPIPYGVKFDSTNLNSILEDEQFNNLLIQIDKVTHQKVLVGVVEFLPNVTEAAPTNDNL